jgi:shikimate dehydrogenase
MTTPIRIAIIGAGRIGRRHIEVIRTHPDFTLAGIAEVDRAKAASDFPDTPVHSDVEDMLDAVRPEAVLVASPNQAHVEHGLACVRRGLPFILEKPVADTVEAAAELCRAVRRAGIPTLVGHHRRHHLQIAETKRLLAEGAIGAVIGVSGVWATRKPAPYFDEGPWRKEAGGGPVLINLIHEIDFLRHCLGEIEAITAVTSNRQRGFAVEDTAALTLQFRSGVLGTFLMSDAAVSPWTMEQGLGEIADFPYSGQSGYRFIGTAGSLEAPRLMLWSQSDPSPDWSKPIHVRPLKSDATHAFPRHDPQRGALDASGRRCDPHARGRPRRARGGGQRGVGRPGGAPPAARRGLTMLDGDTRIIAHVGWPTHSFKAPMIYNPYFESIGCNAAVVPMGVRAEDFAAALPVILRMTTVHGALITMPHKVAVTDFLALASPAVRVSGACNAVRRDAGGGLAGDMFDGEGFARGLLRKGQKIAGATALVVGCGGVGAAISAALAGHGAAAIRLFDIDQAAMDGLARRLTDHFPTVAVSAGSADAGGADIVVNATPLGMRTGDPMPVDPARLAPGTFVGEVVMTREETAFLAAARARGCRTQVGVDMLFEQIPAYLEFFGLPTTTPDRLRKLARISYGT